MTNKQGITQLSVRDLTMVATMIAILIVLGLFPGIPLGIIPVPIVLQNIGVMIAGELLGPRNGSLAVWLFLVLVALGLPLLSGGRGGLATMIGPTGGYIVAWVLVPLLIGWGLKLTGRSGEPYWLVEFAIVWLFGVLFVDGLGAIWVSAQSNIALSASLTSSIAFIPGDTIKAIISVILVRRLRKNSSIF